ncbi:hypothetical protein J7T55_013424 [Diaporthe amygdali]|uniref:uncharacterized protein n=1 Tax=Phomopsis amygdali TaxID=1214568 RepID=UPI0022FEA117|nr:uncharacterized protein J7T55_013424 [Diaporthe amygdali]KAJ0119188.1 hypothetical protein J7T55_013424 [Diaporthe amygdali]
MRAFALLIACLVAIAAAVPENMMEDRLMRRECASQIRSATKITAMVQHAVQTGLVESTLGDAKTSKFIWGLGLSDACGKYHY